MYDIQLIPKADAINWHQDYLTLLVILQNEEDRFELKQTESDQEEDSDDEDAPVLGVKYGESHAILNAMRFMPGTD